MCCTAHSECACTKVGRCERMTGWGSPVQKKANLAGYVGLSFRIALSFLCVIIIGYFLYRGLRFLELPLNAVWAIVFFFNFSSFGLLASVIVTRFREEQRLTRYEYTPHERLSAPIALPKANPSVFRASQEGWEPAVDTGWTPAVALRNGNRPQRASQSLEVAVDDPLVRTLMADIRSARDRLAWLVLKSKQRISVFESGMIEKLQRMTSTGVRSLIAAKRIVNALEERLQQLDGVLATNDPTRLNDAIECLRTPLLIPDDTLSSIMDAQPMPPLLPDDWERTLQSHLNNLGRRKELAQVRMKLT